ncbi:unnamed protein product [Scytosiphon promiscuus]
MFLIGDFEAWTPSEVLAEMKADGVPRFSVCDASIFRDSLLQDGEVAAEKTALYLKPAPECFLYYMSSSAPDPLRSNMVRKSVFEKDVPERGDARAVLSDADKGIEFWIVHSRREKSCFIFTQYSRLWPMETMTKMVEKAMAQGGQVHLLGGVHDVLCRFGVLLVVRPHRRPDGSRLSSHV